MGLRCQVGGPQQPKKKVGEIGGLKATTTESIAAATAASGPEAVGEACSEAVRSLGDDVGLLLAFASGELDYDVSALQIAEADIEAELASAGLAPELERAREVWTRKFGTPPADAREWARQARFLQGRGFPTDVIRRLLREPTE